MKKSVLLLSVIALVNIATASAVSLKFGYVSDVTFPEPGANSVPGKNYITNQNGSILNSNLCMTGGMNYYNPNQSPIISKDNQILLDPAEGFRHRASTANCIATWFNSLPTPVSYTTNNMAPTEKNFPKELLVLMMGSLQFTSKGDTIRCDNMMFGTNENDSKNWYAFSNINNPVNAYPVKKDAVVAQCYKSNDSSKTPLYFYFKPVGNQTVNVISADSVNQ